MRTGSYRNRERVRALVALQGAGVPERIAELVLRDASKLARLAEAQCNGDWPADGGSDRWKTAECKRCGSYWAPSTLKGRDVDGDPLCEDCRAADRIKARLKGFAEVDFGGDPRGYVVKVVIGGREVGLA